MSGYHFHYCMQFQLSELYTEHRGKLVPSDCTVFPSFSSADVSNWLCWATELTSQSLSLKLLQVPLQVVLPEYFHCQKVWQNTQYTKFEVLTVTLMKVSLLYVTLCDWASGSQCSRLGCHHLQNQIIWKVEVFLECWSLNKIALRYFRQPEKTTVWYPRRL
jgi:hypothetical protein